MKRPAAKQNRSVPARSGSVPTARGRARSALPAAGVWLCWTFVKILGRFLLPLLLLLAGCSSYVAHVEPGREPRSLQRYFVKTNLNDNHGIDARIARALKARGFQADYGHLTMLPHGTQAIVTFDDRWSWDFRTHLSYLRIEVEDTRTEQSIARATFQGPAALTAAIDDVIDRLLDQILSQQPPKKK